MKTLIDIIKQKPYLKNQDAHVFNHEVGKFAEEYLDMLCSIDEPHKLIRFVGLLETICDASFEMGKNNVFYKLRKLV